jgi:hypothetical protein
MRGFRDSQQQPRWLRQQSGMARRAPDSDRAPRSYPHQAAPRQSQPSSNGTGRALTALLRSASPAPPDEPSGSAYVMGAITKRP